MVASDRGNVLQRNCSFTTILQPYMGLRRRCTDEFDWSTKGSNLLVLTCRFNRTGSGLLNHVVTERPMLERREKANIRSWGVALGDEHKERTECNASATLFPIASQVGCATLMQLLPLTKLSHCISRSVLCREEYILKCDSQKFQIYEENQETHEK